MPAESKAAVSFKAKPSLARPLNQTGAVKWLREHVFYSAGSVLLTFVLLYLIGQLLYEFVDWALINAVWEAESRRECTNINAEGACWAGVIEWMNNIMYGRYPLDQQWRVDLALGLLVPWLLPLWVRGVRDKHLVGLSAVLVYPFLAGPLILGGERGWLTQGLFALSLTVFAWIVLQCMAGVLGNCSFHDWVDKQGKRLGFGARARRGMFVACLFAVFVAVFLLGLNRVLPEVRTNEWGGLFLTLVIAGVGICISLPGGIVLELARRSSMPLIRVTTRVFVEIFRSVPLITVLFMSVTLMPLFLPETFQLNKLVQAMIGISLFSSCYMTEIIRAGMRSLPKGQYEAAHALGFGYGQTMGLIILPQALKQAIPNIVGTFIDLLRDTTLVSIIGLFDFLLMLRAVGRSQTWLGLFEEPLVFGATVFFVFCYGMSKYSQHLERNLGQGREQQ